MRNTIILAFLLVAGSASAQNTAFFTDGERNYHLGETVFDYHIHSRAMLAYDDFLERDVASYEPDYAMLQTHAEFKKAESAIQLGLPEADRLITAFIEKHRPDPVAVDATIAIANFYFSARKYDEAVVYYEMLGSQDVPRGVFDEALFKTGYCHYMQRQYDEAENYFQQVSPQSRDYYYAANYYQGVCRFQEEDYKGAVENFSRVTDSPEYRDEAQYYTALLYFASGQYEKVIQTGLKALSADNVQNKDEISHIIGQSYFELGKYPEALPYLEAYDAKANKMTRGEFYQLAFTQYITGNCESASQTFKSIAGEKDAFGQRANFYIGVCQLQTGELQEARNAFRSVSRIEADPQLQEEALFNYGKLSAQLKYDSEAIHTLNSIPTSSPYYNEAQQVLRDLFNNTRDYSTSLMTLDGVAELSPTMKEAYQSLSFKLAMQNLRDGNEEGAITAFHKVAKYPIDPSLSAQAVFWRGEIEHRIGNYSESRELLNRYFTLAKTTSKIPAEASVPMANYTQGYNYLYNSQYGMARDFFSNAVAGIRADTAVSYMPNIENILADSETRTADCFFKLGRYEEANTRYTAVIEMGGYESVYASLQKAMILGLQGMPIDKILMLEEIVQQHGQSKYADDALYQAATTNQELGNSDRALQQYATLTKDYPNSEYINSSKLRMGLISYNNGDLSSAIDYYKGVFASNPTGAEAQEALLALEEIYVHDLSKPDEYISFTENVPGYSVDALRKDSITYRSAEYLYENGEYAKAVTAFENYMQQYPSGVYTIKAYYFHGESKALLKDYIGALRSYDAVVDRGPSSYYIPALKKAALLTYNGNEDFQASTGYYAKLTATVTDPEELYSAHLGLMRSAFRSGDLKKSARSAEYLLGFETTPRDIAAEAHFCVAKDALSANDPDKAIVHFNEVIRSSDNAMTAESRYQIARIYFNRQQFQLAEELCHNANSANANYPEWVAKGLILLSDIYYAQGDYFNAKAPLEAILESFTGEKTIVEQARTKLSEVKEAEQRSSRLIDDESVQNNENDPRNE